MSDKHVTFLETAGNRNLGIATPDVSRISPHVANAVRGYSTPSVNIRLLNRTNMVQQSMDISLANGQNIQNKFIQTRTVTKG